MSNATRRSESLKLGSQNIHKTGQPLGPIKMLSSTTKGTPLAIKRFNARLKRPSAMAEEYNTENVSDIPGPVFKMVTLIFPKGHQPGMGGHPTSRASCQRVYGILSLFPL
ncbi:hypothetical protein CDAR_457341 [Caerostris darwini]|uniref:Uncharacterized protein n=1 Tax=Caerostris darwini TaxID=1538125 RepID=A0AAV4PBN3_9ARAC|nr:hypothetical protein CDAR_457341 [Caerostris darwini]